MRISCNTLLKFEIIPLAVICLFQAAAQIRRGIQGVVSSSMAGEARTALVIGNGAYVNATLRNPVNDARALAEALRSSGFTVMLRENVNKAQMKAAISEFGGKIRNGGVGLFYFSGHGVQLHDRNYLIPVGANIEYEQHVDLEAVDVGYVTAEMENAQNRLNVVILDACRNNPFARSFRSATRGLAQMMAPRGTLVAYSTTPGTVALDGDGVNSPYTKALVSAIREPGLELMDVFKSVRSKVRVGTKEKQIPMEYSSVEGDFYFVTAGSGAEPSISEPSGTGADLGKYEAAAGAAAAARAKWQNWQTNMTAAYQKAQSLDRNTDLTSGQKAGMWSDFISGYTDDNPNSSEDETMRSNAVRRKSYWLAYQPPSARPAPPVTNRSDVEFVLIQGGTFQMGDVMVDNEANDEKPVHSVTVSDFYLGKTEVTVSQFRAFCSATGRSMPEAPSWGWQDDNPIVNVSWNDAKAFCDWAGVRLPTEAEWEYAAREGGKNVRFGNGKNTADPEEINFDARAEYKKPYSLGGRYRQRTISVASFAPNSLGLYDMSGNVWEWCSDWYGENYYSNSPSMNPQGPSSGSARVLRGGSWDYSPWLVRCAFRGWGNPGLRYLNSGFRVAR
jgi:formylglycine-generating enzyme required for sulfatase activity